MSGDYVERLEAFLDGLGTQTDVYTAAAAKATKGDLRAALDELKQLRARAREEIERRSYAVTHAKVCEEKCDKALAELEQLRAGRTFLDGQVFISGWYAHAEACASLGWDAREAAWRKYREEMTATLAKAEVAPQQSGHGGAE